jgi:hypothetical protein
MTNKKCRSCESTKPLEDFHRNRQSKDGRKGVCKECVCRKERNGRSCQARDEFQRRLIAAFPPERASI